MNFLMVLLVLTLILIHKHIGLRNFAELSFNAALFVLLAVVGIAFNPITIIVYAVVYRLGGK